MAFLNMWAAGKRERRRGAILGELYFRPAVQFAALRRIRQNRARGARRENRHRRSCRGTSMLRFAANVSMLFPEAPFLDRFALAARAGFAAVECQFPYEAPAAEIRARLDDLGLRMVLHTLPAGDWAAGDRGLACLPGRVDEFRAGVPRAIAYAHALGVAQ